MLLRVFNVIPSPAARLGEILEYKIDELIVDAFNNGVDIAVLVMVLKLPVEQLDTLLLKLLIFAVALFIADVAVNVLVDILLEFKLVFVIVPVFRIPMYPFDESK